MLSVVFLLVGCTQQTQDSTQTIRYVIAEQAVNIIHENADDSDFIIVDLRTPEEFSEGHIVNTINVDFRDPNFRKEISKLARDNTYLIYCRSGNRSRGALSLMLELGFTDIYHLYTGIIEWLDKGLPIVK